MKPLVIYHASCADGFGAAFAAWLKLGDDAEYVPMQYGKETDQFFTLEDGTFDSDFNILNREIFILDFSFPRWVMDGLFSVAKRVVWLDHHKSAFEMWCGKAPELFFTMHKEADDRKYILLDDCKSGAYLAWEFFHPGTEVPMLIKHIDDYDRWQFKIDGTKAFQKAIWSYAPWSFEQWKEKFYDPYSGAEFYCDHGREQLITEGEAILRAHEQNVQSVVKGAARACRLMHVKDQVPSWYQTHEHWEAEFDVDANGLAANCPPHLQSDVGHELATQSGTFGLLWFIDKDNVCRCSLRSNGDYDVSAIAKVFGGGGHRNAAGFTTDIQTLLDWIK